MSYALTACGNPLACCESFWQVFRMGSSVNQMLSLDQATASWQHLANCVDTLLAAWQTSDTPPRLAEFLPAEPAALRRIVLIELIKIDMEQRLHCVATFKTLEEYASEFPELDIAALPCDLIYEEYHLRKSAGQTVSSVEYFARFPEQAEQLSHLLGVGAPQQTTSLTRASHRPHAPEPGESLDDFDLLTRLGQGAFATVFLARQRSLQRLVGAEDLRRSWPGTANSCAARPSAYRTSLRSPAVDRAANQVALHAICGRRHAARGD